MEQIYLAQRIDWTREREDLLAGVENQGLMRGLGAAGAEYRPDYG